MLDLTHRPLQTVGALHHAVVLLDLLFQLCDAVIGQTVGGENAAERVLPKQ